MIELHHSLVLTKVLVSLSNETVATLVTGKYYFATTHQDTGMRLMIELHHSLVLTEVLVTL